MKKMIAKSISGCVTAALVFGLAACGGGSKTPVTETPAQSQTEAEQTGETAAETQPAQTETEAPAEPSESEIANAYLQILRRDESRIRAYNWQTDWGQAGKPVAITDVNGDEIPELIYAAVSEDPDRAMFAADLHIYTYEADEKEAEELYDHEMWDVAVAGGSRYLLFREKDGSFWAYTSAGDEQWTNCFERFAMKDDDDMVLSPQAKKFTYPDENYTTRIEEYTGPEDKEITAEEYESQKAALIDGCTRWQTYWKVVYPLLGPTTATVAIIDAMAFWNDYLLPSLILTKQDLYTIPIATQMFYGSYASDMGCILAALILAMLPILILYLIMQKYIVEGVTSGAVKG